jgi:oligopeptide transport system substrate-binding protein
MAAGLLSPALLAACSKKVPEKGAMRIALRGEADSLDPFKAEFAIADLLFPQYLLPLVGFGDNGTTIPCVASSWEGVDNFTSWIFTINQNLKWSDGKPLTTDDVLQSFRRGANWKTAYPDAPELFSIKGFEEAIKTKGNPANIGVSIIAPDKIKIDLLASDAHFPAQVQEFYAVPTHILAKYGDDWTKLENIVVSGPYKPVVYTQTRIRFAKNPNGDWAKLGFNPNLPNIIDVDTVPEAATRIRMYQSGDVDLSQDPALLRYTDLKEKYGDKFLRMPAPLLIYMSINTKHPKLQDKDIRRALGMAFNRNIISHNLLRDAVHPANRMVRTEPLLPFDRDGARKILESKGYNASNTLKLDLLVPKDDRERAAVQIVNSWKQIWVEATISSTDSSAISARLNGHDFETALVKIDKGLKSDPIDLMASFASGGNAYSHQWINHDFDAALKKARSIADEKQRHEAVLAAEKFIIDEAPILPVWFGDAAWLISDRVKGGRKGIPPVIWSTLEVKN